VYDFALPPLVLHTLYTRDATALTQWIGMRPRNAITVLDTHDGIGVRDAAPDRERRTGLLSLEAIDALVDTIHERSGGASRHASGGAASNLDTHQINCTFYDALGARDEEYLIARAIQCFVPGIPQVYYVGLLAGRNDLTLLRRTGVGRDINRHYYTREDVQEQVKRPVVQRLMALLRFRATHKAFAGAFHTTCPARDHVLMEWAHGAEWAKLDVNLTNMTASVTCSHHDAEPGGLRVW